MPNAHGIYYRLEGLPSHPLLVLVHSLGADHGLWNPQIPALLTRFQVLRLDVRGHGASHAPAGDYSIAQLAGDVLATVDATHHDKFAYCGLSLGGMIGQWLGANAADRMTGLVLANTSPRVPDPSLFETRRRTALEQGMSAIAGAAIERSFTARTRSTPNPAVESIRASMLGTNPVGYAGCCAAIRDMDLCPLLATIKVPTLVIGCEHDISTPHAGHGDLLAATVPGARCVMLDAAHLSNVERPSSFTAALFDFLAPAAAGGETIRRSMLGDAHVDRSLAAATDFTRDFQEMVTRYAWGAVWTRPGLDPRTRRWLVLAITASLGRWEEFRLHLRAGLARELEMPDLKEVLLMVSVYAGVPAANTAFQIASEELKV